MGSSSTASGRDTYILKGRQSESELEILVHASGDDTYILKDRKYESELGILVHNERL